MKDHYLMGLYGILGGGTPLLARWTTDWDSNNQTSFWYVIKDEPFDINRLKSKRRYVIKKACENFSVKKIKDPTTLKNELLKVTNNCYLGWPSVYRPSVDEKGFLDSVDRWDELDVFAAFHNETGLLCGYAYLKDYGNYANFPVLRTDPNYERQGVNAALISFILEYYNERLKDGFYINDGSRNILHETNFQDYLEKYFGFRKVYCTLHVIYRPWVRIIVHILFPFRNKIAFKSRIGRSIKGILNLEAFNRDH